MNNVSINQILLIVVMGILFIVLTFIVKRYEENKEFEQYEKEIQQKNFIKKIENFKF